MKGRTAGNEFKYSVATAIILKKFSQQKYRCSIVVQLLVLSPHSKKVLVNEWRVCQSRYYITHSSYN